MLHFRLIFFSFYFITVSYAQNGSLDTTFNTLDNGYWGNGTEMGFMNDIKQLPNDQFALIGLGSYDGHPGRSVARLNFDGSCDTSFIAEIYPTFDNFFLNAGAIQSDGKIVVVGSDYGGPSAGFIARLDTNGTLDQSFSNGFLFDESVNDVVVQQDGKIIVVGKFGMYNGTQANRIIRLNPDGSIDNTFFISSTPAQVNHVVNDVELDSTGGIFVGGSFDFLNGFNADGIAKLLPDGTEDATFTGSGNTISDLEITSNGSIMIVGSFNTYNGVTKNGICRLQPNGTIDPTFISGTGFLINGSDYPKKVIELSNGNYLVYGGAQYNGVQTNGATQIDSTGAIDVNFNFQPGFYTNGNGCILERTDGKIILIKQVGKLCLFNTDGTKNFDFNIKPGIYCGTNLTSASGVEVIKVLADNRMLVGGSFESYNNESVNSIIRLSEDGVYDPTFFVDSLVGNVYAIATQPDGKHIIGGSFTLDGSQTIPDIARIYPDGSLDTTFNVGTGFNDAGTSSRVNQIEVQPDGKVLVAGTLSVYNGTSIGSVCRLNPDGTLDNSFQNSTITGNVFKLILAPDGRIYVGGETGGFNGFFKRLLDDGTIDNAFSSSYDVKVTAMGLQADGKIVICNETTSIQDEAIVRLNMDGTRDMTFALAATCPEIVLTVPYSVKPLNDGRILVAGYTNANYCAPILFSLDQNGIFDNLFVSIDPIVEYPFSHRIKCVELQSGNRLLIGGMFHKYLNTFKNGIARLDITDPSASLTENISVPNQKMIVSPNPTHDLIHIQLPRISTGEIIICDLSGRIVTRHEIVQQNALQFSLTTAKSGTYLVYLLENGNQSPSVRFTKL